MARGTAIVLAALAASWNIGATAAERSAFPDPAAAEAWLQADLTEAGQEAKCVMFRCKGASCVDAVWNEVPSKSGWTDVYLQDQATRQRVFDAFRALQKSRG